MFESVDCALVARKEDAARVVLGAVEVAVAFRLRTRCGDKLGTTLYCCGVRGVGAPD